MKIGILTHPLGSNYGGILQNYALQCVLKGLGHQPVTYYYYVKDPIKIKVLSFCKRLLLRLRGENTPLRGWPNKRELSIIECNTRGFIDSRIEKTKRFYLHNTTIFKNEKVDAIIVGSDQVWRGGNPDIMHYFLSDFIGVAVPKIAYAASFGVDYWEYSPKETKLCAKLLSHFKAVSVREVCGVTLCEQHLNRKVEFMLDPTLVVDRVYYDTLLQEKEDCGRRPDRYIMTYLLDKSKEKHEIIKSVTKQLGLKPYTVMPDCYFAEVGKEKLEECVYPPVEQWLKGFRDADYVVTDSFHGTVFAIIYHKKFLTIINKKRGASRFTSLLGLLQLEDRIIESDDEVASVLSRPINYERVDRILKDKRIQCIDFLKRNLS